MGTFAFAVLYALIGLLVLGVVNGEGGSLYWDVPPSNKDWLKIILLWPLVLIGWLGD